MRGVCKQEVFFLFDCVYKKTSIVVEKRLKKYTIGFVWILKFFIGKHDLFILFYCFRGSVSDVDLCIQ